MYSQVYQEKYVNAAKMLAIENSQQGIKTKPVHRRSVYGFDGRIRDKKYDKLFDSKFAKYMKKYMIIIVTLSVFAYNFQTLPLLRRTKTARDIWQYLEIFFTVNYIIDWLVQFYFYPYYTDDSKFKTKKKTTPAKKQWTYSGYFKSINTYINFLCFVPCFLEYMFPIIKFDNFEQAYSHSWIILIFRSFRAIRFFQILYTSRTTSGKMMNYVILSLKMAYPGIISFLLIVAVAFLCFAEDGFDLKVKQGEACSVQSIIDSLWYTLIALSTIGYGDYIPFSALGRVATAIAVMFCLFIFALPTISISSFLSKLLIEIHNNNSITKVTEKLNELTISHRKQDMTILNNLYTIKSGIKSNNPVTLFEIFKNDVTDNTKPKLEKRRSFNQYIKETMKNNGSIYQNQNVNKNVAANEDTVNSSKLLQVNLPKNVAKFPNLESIIIGNYDDNFYTIQSIGDDNTTQTTNVNLSTMFNAATHLKNSPEASASTSPSKDKRASFDPKTLNLEEVDFEDNNDDDEEDSLSESDDDSDSSSDSAIREKLKQLNKKSKANNNNVVNLPKSFQVNAKSNEEYYQLNNNLTKTTMTSVSPSEVNEEEDEALNSEDMSFSIDMFEKIMIDYKNICRNEIEHLANRYKKVQKVKEKYEEAAIFQELFDRDILKNK
ncbi:voltage-gated potassium channel [Piromyces finnis]|uniref:Voltage-gated potassium channel n=1 Tax=Piromyces finnis TaxID=1754191 RepID=A0A1Y1V8R3_9FUNG|nr:voltage-gated potassium channel [Piromyces finnis]|eukprot:ORX49304.1 voltage-gated potassium channel [Piromyces finnis]